MGRREEYLDIERLYRLKLERIERLSKEVNKRLHEIYKNRRYVFSRQDKDNNHTKNKKVSAEEERRFLEKMDRVLKQRYG